MLRMTFASRGLAALLFVVAGAARAEAPLHVDDAGTLDPGGAKIEAAWGRAGSYRGPEITIGYGVAAGLELGLTVNDARDRGAGSRLQGVAVAAKWVPIRAEAGWSLGAMAETGRSRDRQNGFAGRTYETETALSGLATWRNEAGQAVHLTLGAAHQRPADKTAATWGLAVEHPLMEKLQALAEIHGTSRSGPDRALGLRYTIQEGLKVSLLGGRGNGESFGQIGFAWEF